MSLPRFALKRAVPLSLSASALALLVGCGGAEPLSAMNLTETPQLILPVAEAQVNVVSPFIMSGTGAQNDGFNVTTINPTVGATVISPASGIVLYLENNPGSALVYIKHSPHIMSRLSQLQSVNVQPGSIVQPGSAIGSASSSGAAVRFTVFVDNVLACPLSYLSYAQQRVVTAHAGGVSPCS